MFYDRKLGSNIVKARHALVLDELRDDFEPTIWEQREGVDLKQVWFDGVHSDVGGCYKPDGDGSCLADIPMLWLSNEAIQSGLTFEEYMSDIDTNVLASQHNEYKGKYLLLGKHQREIPDPDRIPTSVHAGVKAQYDGGIGYTSKTVEGYIAKHSEWPPICD